MAAQPPTELWTEKEYAPFKSAQRAFICPGYDDGGAAINAVYGKFGCRPGAAHPLNPALFSTTDVQVKNRDGPTTWIVVVPYSYLTGAQTLGSDVEPLLRPTRVEIEPGTTTELADCDVYGNPYFNSAGFPFETPFYRTFKTLRIIATRYYPNYDIALGLKYMNKTNASPVSIKSLGTLQAEQFSCEFIGPTNPIILTQPAPIEVRHVFEVRGPLVSGVSDDPGFRRRVLDSGRQGWYKDSSGKFQPEEFSSPQTFQGRSYYKTRSQPCTFGDTVGIPDDPNVKLGEGFAPQNPASRGNPWDSNVIRKQIANGKYYLLFAELEKIEFAPLLSGL